MSETLFAVVQGYDKAPQSEWFRYCRRMAKPYVVIRPHANSADVMWDYTAYRHKSRFPHVDSEKAASIFCL